MIARWIAGLALASLLAGAAGEAGAQARIERFAAAPPAADEVMLQSASTLGEPRHFCADVPGFGALSEGLAGWELGWPLEVHTCKLGLAKSHYFYVDQLVSRSGLGNGRIHFTRMNVCAEVHRTGATPETVVREDSWVILAKCSASERQRFVVSPDGRIHVAIDPAKCLTIGAEAHEAGNRAPGQPWFQRDLTVSTCSPREANRQSWRSFVPTPDPA